MTAIYLCVIKIFGKLRKKGKTLLIKEFVSTDTSATYFISDIHLEFEQITSPELAMTLKRQNQRKQTILYDRVQQHEKRTFNKRNTTGNISLQPNVKSMKGILILFIDPNDSGQLYDRDPEKFYNPKTHNVSITIYGNPNQLYSSGMQKHQQWDEIRKHFADARHRTVGTVAQELDMKLADYLTTKYGLWLDMKSTDDDALHGSGRKM